MNAFQKYRAERNAAFIALDIEWARSVMDGKGDDEVLLVALHKARYDCADIGRALRLESGEWLRARGFGRAHGGPLLPPGELES